MDRRFFNTGILATATLAACQGDPAHSLFGKKLPVVRGVYTDGTAFELSSTAKPAIIRFWGMWCGPCMLDMPNWLSVVRDIRASEDKLKEINLMTIHVGLPPANGQTLMQWAASQAGDVATPVVDDRTFSISKAVGISGTPSTIYIDREGIIREHAWQFKNARGVASFMRKIARIHAKS
jgi:thiol-disulfide isomerase/thioredoxin